MTEIIGIIFFGGIVIALILDDKKSSDEFYKKSNRDLKNDKIRLKERIEFLEKEASNFGIKEHNKKLKIEENIARALSIVTTKDEYFGKQISLKEFIEDNIARNGVEKTKSNYGVLVKVFELAGRNVSQSYQIYRQVFNDLPDQLHFTPPDVLPSNFMI